MVARPKPKRSYTTSPLFLTGALLLGAILAAATWPGATHATSQDVAAAQPESAQGAPAKDDAQPAADAKDQSQPGSPGDAKAEPKDGSRQPPAGEQTDKKEPEQEKAPAEKAPAEKADGGPAEGEAEENAEQNKGADEAGQGAKKSRATLAAEDEAAPEPQKEGLPGWLLIGSIVVTVALPILVGQRLANAFKMTESTGRIILVGVVSMASVVVCALGYSNIKLGIDLKGGSILVYQIEAASTDYDIDELVRAVNKRVNPDGVKEVTVRPFGKDQIEVIIPEADRGEMRRIVDRISRTGALEFRIVAIRKYHQELIDAGRQLDLGEVEVKEDGETVARWTPVSEAEQADRFLRDGEGRGYAVRQRRNRTEVLVSMLDEPVTGTYLSSAKADFDSQNGQPCVSFTFNAEGANLFEQLTRDNAPDPYDGTRRELAIILDGQLYSAPTINEPIRERGQITGKFTQEETQELAAVLTAGSLPATLHKEPVSVLTTGATLGQDTILKGVLSMAVSTVAVIAFMLYYYRFAGVVANLALLLNVLIILAFMIVFQGVFTLSGLAGLALTVGMAVDANVLIYERMREESHRGATLRMAIRNGFDRATTTIVDANVTTLITAAVLYAIGTDQVKGFAITLILGLVANLFTAITVSRLLFDIAERTRFISALNMRQAMSNPNFDFIGKRKAAVVLSIVTIGVGLAGVLVRGKGLLDIDFTGGVSVEVLLEEPVSVGQIRADLASVKELTDLTVQDVNITEEGSGRRFIVNTSFQGDPDRKNADGEPLGPDLQVEEVIAKAFAGRLAVNSLTFDAKGIQQVETPPEPAIERPESAKSGDQSAAPVRRPDTELPESADLAAAAGQDALPPAGESEVESAAKQESDTQGKPNGDQPGDEKTEGANDAPSPVAKPDLAPAETSRVTLHLSQAIDHDSLYARITEHAPRAAFALSNENYDRGSAKGFTEWTLTIDRPAAETEAALTAVAAKLNSEPYFPSSNVIGATVASSTQVQAATAMLVSVALILAYVWFRFQQVSFGFAAVLAVVHDVLVALGGLALSLWLADFLGFLQVQEFKINLPIIAAFLTIIGYSLNDTIVIFDRIREVRGKSPRITAELVNSCINQTLSRTILTSLTVFIVVLILYFFGGQGIHGFAFTLVVGVISGTYSTVYIATPVLLWSYGNAAFDKGVAPTGQDARSGGGGR